MSTSYETIAEGSVEKDVTTGDVAEKNDMDETTVVPTSDPYAYIDNNGFTSERYKIEIRGLPKYYGIGELKKLLNVKLGLKCSKIKSPGTRNFWVFVCFRSEEDRENGLKILQNYKWKGSVLQAKVADPAPDPLVKRRNEERSGGNSAKKLKLDTPEDEETAIKNSATPLWNVPYKDQLDQKTNEVKCLLRRLGIELVKTNKNLKTWIDHQKQMNDGLPCKLLDIKALPDECDYYRNKCEFSIGKNALTGQRTVGFRLGSYASGSLEIAPVHGLKNFSQRMMSAVNIFEKFVRGSDLEVFAPETLKGHWRQLTVRVGVVTGHLMLIVGFHPQDLTEAQINCVKEKLKDFFVNGEGAELHVNSLYFQFMKRKEFGQNVTAPELLLGDTCIEEVVCGLTFKISPLSFFQINTKCANLLMESAKELSGITSETTLLDICCGTGTIGLCLAKDCGQVLGLELVEEAVRAARENALKNNITNCEFFCGKADEILTQVVGRAKFNHVVAIIDPPRAGLHQRAIGLLRKTKNLERIVFLSCDPKSAFKNFTELGRAPSKTLLGVPFVPVAAVPVDMFPHTNHFELILYFERLDIAQKMFGECNKTESEDNVTEIKLESENNTNEIKPEPEDNVSKIKLEPEDNATEIKPEPEDNATEIKPEPEDNVSKIKLEPEDNATEIKPEPEDNATKIKLEFGDNSLTIKLESEDSTTKGKPK